MGRLILTWSPRLQIVLSPGHLTSAISLAVLILLSSLLADWLRRWNVAMMASTQCSVICCTRAEYIRTQDRHKSYNACCDDNLILKMLAFDVRPKLNFMVNWNSSNKWSLSDNKINIVDNAFYSVLTLHPRWVSWSIGAGTIWTLSLIMKHLYYLLSSLCIQDCLLSGHDI